MSFADSLNKICKRAGDKAEMVVRKTALELQSQMIERSPVGNPNLWEINKQAVYMRETHNLFVDAMNADAAITGARRTRRMGKKKLKETYKLSAGEHYTGGRFKGNWQVGIGAMNETNDSPPDKSGKGALGRANAVLQGWKPGQTIVLSNSLPYAKRLELGWSKQAPAGVVRLTVQNYSAALANAVAGLKD